MGSRGSCSCAAKVKLDELWELCRLVDVVVAAVVGRAPERGDASEFGVILFRPTSFLAIVPFYFQGSCSRSKESMDGIHKRVEKRSEASS